MSEDEVPYVTQSKFIDHDFKLPNHSNELSQASEAVDKLKVRVKTIIETPYITNRTFVKHYEEIIKVLDYVGRLSIPTFNINDEMERLYVLKYPHSPQLAKHLWFEHYEAIHKPYTLLKNRCFRMLDELDAHYVSCNEKNPPNWKY